MYMLNGPPRRPTVLDYERGTLVRNDIHNPHTHTLYHIASHYAFFRCRTLV